MVARTRLGLRMAFVLSKKLGLVAVWETPEQEGTVVVGIARTAKSAWAAHRRNPFKWTPALQLTLCDHGAARISTRYNITNVTPYGGLEIPEADAWTKALGEALKQNPELGITIG